MREEGKRRGGRRKWWTGERSLGLLKGPLVFVPIGLGRGFSACSRSMFSLRLDFRFAYHDWLQRWRSDCPNVTRPAPARTSRAPLSNLSFEYLKLSRPLATPTPSLLLHYLSNLSNTDTQRPHRVYRTHVTDMTPASPAPSTIRRRLSLRRLNE